MKPKQLLICLILLITVIGANIHSRRVVGASVEPQRISQLQAPLLKWQHGGCYNSWCESGWYSSPAVGDLDGDGKPEVIGASYSLFALNGEDGSVQWSVDPPGGRIWPGVVLADLSGDGDLEIAVSSGGGHVAVYNHLGQPEPGWPQNPAVNELRSLAVADLDGSGSMELVVGQAKLDKINAWVFEYNGVLRPGWPQVTTTEGSAAGIYNDNIGLGDIDGDGQLELFIPSDTITISGYEPDGSALPTHPMYHDQSGHDMDFWGEVPAYVDLAFETRGWGPCYEAFTARANFADGPANVVDVDGDGIMELVVSGDVHNCNTSPYTDLYNTVYIFNLDRSRFNAGGYDWTTPPVNTGAPVIQDYNVLESVAPNPVTVDLDGDGEIEILFPSYDGKMHAFWLDKTEHGSWPYPVYKPAEGFYRGASEPVVADLDNNGSPEIIFSSWVQKGTGRTGKLHILDYLGNVIHEIELPSAFGSPDWNGAMAAPTLADIDGDPDLELVLNTANSGFVAYDLPGTADARILWGTGRGSYQRTGAVMQGDLYNSTKTASVVTPAAGSTISYTITLDNPGPILHDVVVTDTLPSGVAFAGNLSASSGTPSEAAGIISWSGDVPSADPVFIRFQVTISSGITAPELIINTVLIDNGVGNVIQRQAAVIVDGRATFLPLVAR